MADMDHNAQSSEAHNSGSSGQSGASFTADQLAELIKNSPGIQAMKLMERYQLSQLLWEPESDAAKQLFAILQEEKQRLAHVDKTFDQIVTKAMDDLDVGLIDLARKASKEYTAIDYKEAQQQDLDAAEELLESL